MFRLSKGNQSRKNHKIIHQTTKVSENDAPLSTPAMCAAQHAAEQQRMADEEKARIEKEAMAKVEAQKVPVVAAKCDSVTEMIINEEVNKQNYQPTATAVIQPVQDMESYIIKMREYMIYMKELEARNAKLEYENLRYRAENEQLKGQLTKTPPPPPTNPPKIQANKPEFPITEKIRANLI